MVPTVETMEVEREGEPLLLDNQLCYELYAAAQRMTKADRPVRERIGLTDPQYSVLLGRWGQEGGTDGDRRTPGARCSARPAGRGARRRAQGRGGCGAAGIQG